MTSRNVRSRLLHRQTKKIDLGHVPAGSENAFGRHQQRPTKLVTIICMISRAMCSMEYAKARAVFGNSTHQDT